MGAVYDEQCETTTENGDDADDRRRYRQYEYAKAISNSENSIIQRRNNGRNNDSDRIRTARRIIPARRHFIPWASLMALIVTWAGLFVFSTKLYSGMIDLEDQAKGLFKFLIPYLRHVRQAVVILAIIMACLTLMMLVVGFFATLHVNRSYRGRLSSCLCSRLGSRVMCALFWILSYLMNFCWMGILSLIVVMTSAYVAFLPICLPQSGSVDHFCLNFTVITSMIGGGSDPGVNLLLCGHTVDKLCKLTKAILPWYWGAYLGCVAVLLGLSHFNGSLAANFAHGKHAYRYRKIRDRTASHIKWTKSWHVAAYVPNKNPADLSPQKIVTGRYLEDGKYETTIQNGVLKNGSIPNGKITKSSKRRKGKRGDGHDYFSSPETSFSSQVDSDFETETTRPVSQLETSAAATHYASNGSIVVSMRNNDVEQRAKNNRKLPFLLDTPPSTYSAKIADV